jgi:hypothetical protein
MIGMYNKLKVCVECNDVMGGMDVSDQYVVTYSATRKRMKLYYQKIFYHLLNTTMFNSYEICMKRSDKYTHLQFHWT